MGIPFAASLVVGMWGIDRQNSMWRDESVTYQVAHRSLSDIWTLLGHIDAVHGLYYLVMHVVFSMWDGGLVALRAPSVVAVSMAAAGVGALGARLAGYRVGTLAGLVSAVLPMVQQYAQEGRSYALVYAVVVWSTYFVVRALAQPKSRWWWSYAGALILACWLHEFAALAMVAHGVALWLLHATRTVWHRWSACGVGVLVATIPLAVVSAGQSERQLGWLGRPSLTSWWHYAAISGAGLLLAWVLRRARATQDSDASRRVLIVFSASLLVVPSGLLMTVSLVKPWYVDRYVIYTMAGLALLVGAGLDLAISRRHLFSRLWQVGVAIVAVAAALAILVPWSLLMRTPESRKDDVVAIAEAVDRSAAEGDGVLFMPSRRREWLLSHPSVYQRLNDLALAQSPAASGTLQGTEDSAAGIRRQMLASGRILALMDPAGQPLDPYPQEVVKRKTLKDDFQVCERTQLRGAQLVVYARPGKCGKA
ncbi:glycosyltransferase family 39 protein [Streptomyces sp. DT2A-34]|uniref:glycosyltransferase family 39 protein n=1 Tax=Streptomyces sp. DT2A-34 TaxID=3051182 RepID=UPI00265B9228|nr:glycosyltransferase family 39 protein [Streptomyces sp. DT2A-34]MDO0913567.1 glycosyltransferase family 39 protein [Streptomyces sp. DT2A-34]